MARPCKFPPQIRTHKRGYSYIRVAGVDRRLGLPGSAEAQSRYTEACAELVANGGRFRPAAITAAALTVAALLVRWWAEHALGHYSARGKELVQFKATLRPLRRLFGALPVADFGPEQLEELQKEMVRLDWCRNTINRRIVRVRTLWRWAERKRLVPEGRWAALCAVPGLGKGTRGVRHTQRRPPTSREDLDAVLPFCVPAIAAALELQWWAGMRSEEVRGMRTADVDRSADVWVYRVRPEFDKNAWREDHPPRVVPLGPECQRLLAPWLRDDDLEGFVFRPQRQRRRRGGEAPEYRDKCYTGTGYAQAVRRACELASARLGREVKCIPYGGRHAAKMRITRAAGADAARAQLGQTSIETTAHYGSLDVEHASEVMRRIG